MIRRGFSTTYLPHCGTTEKNKPASHVVCMSKCTLVKVHGVGTAVVVTIPDLESQGGNLTFDCAPQRIMLFCKKTGIIKIRNLFVQSDNLYSNKAIRWQLHFRLLLYLEYARR
jgi:hypothetical protein